MEHLIFVSVYFMCACMHIFTYVMCVRIFQKRMGLFALTVLRYAFKKFIWATLVNKIIQV